MQSVSKGSRCHIGIYGRRNVGKSSLINLITQQEVSIISAQAGTTTDYVEKTMEFLPLGPVLFIDTAGLDDEGDLGKARINKTKRLFDRTDLALLVTEADVWTDFEEQLLKEFKQRDIPTIIVLNKIDTHKVDQNIVNRFEHNHCISITTRNKSSIQLIREAILAVAPNEFFVSKQLVGDLLNPGDIVIYVIPIDSEAPKGRLLLPQVQALRDSLDKNAISIVVKLEELKQVLSYLKVKPKLVIVDSSTLGEVKNIIPKNILLTSFSILYSRLHGDLAIQAAGAMAIDKLIPGDQVLISESCSHHPIGEDIGRIKIPRWLKNHAGGKLDISVIQGHDFPTDLADYKLVILCGSCMINRKEVLQRIVLCKNAGVPCTNYGLVIAHCSNILARVLEPFSEVKDLIKSKMGK